MSPSARPPSGGPSRQIAAAFGRLAPYFERLLTILDALGVRNHERCGNGRPGILDATTADQDNGVLLQVVAFTADI